MPDEIRVQHTKRCQPSASFRQVYQDQHNVIQLDIAELKVTMPKDEDMVDYLQKCEINELRNAYQEPVDKAPLSFWKFRTEKGAWLINRSMRLTLAIGKSNIYCT